jgi:pimeloyl-ACP methyl ester carboxylesterase
LLLAGGAAPAATPSAANLEEGRLRSCELPGVGETVRCGELTVPEDPRRPSGRTISIFVVVLPALSANPRSDPWVEITGGPGNAATDYAQDYVSDYRHLRRDRDVLLVDQRGTGRSNGLYCEELSLHRVASFFPRWPADGVQSCRARLSATADLSQYSTLNAAHDLEAVRRWLGYSQLNLFSYSYGAHAALEYMRAYPDRVRSAILWGVVPPDFRRPLHYARDGQRALDRLFADCRADRACRATYPRPAEQLRQVMLRLARSPVPLQIRHPVTGQILMTEITQAGVAQALWVALTRPDYARRLPLIIDAAWRGDFQPLIDLDVARQPPRRRYYNAMHLSVACPEETMQINPSAIPAAHAGTFMPADRTIEYNAACRAWGVRARPSSELRPVRVDTPTLIISGGLDPITPPHWGELVHRALPRSRHIVIRHLSHESNGLADAACLDRMFAAFVDDPRPQAISVACIGRMTPPAFARREVARR